MGGTDEANECSTTETLHYRSRGRNHLNRLKCDAKIFNETLCRVKLRN